MENNEVKAVESAPAITEEKILLYREKLLQEQNLPMGVAAGVAAALVGAAIWAIAR
ncbi:MAG: hypothetical protein ACKOE6_13515 [Flammeovirgaceae bacterium]